MNYNDFEPYRHNSPRCSALRPPSRTLRFIGYFITRSTKIKIWMCDEYNGLHFELPDGTFMHSYTCNWTRGR